MVGGGLRLSAVLVAGGSTGLGLVVLDHDAIVLDGEESNGDDGEIQDHHELKLGENVLDVGDFRLADGQAQQLLVAD